MVPYRSSSGVCDEVPELEIFRRDGSNAVRAPSSLAVRPCTVVGSTRREQRRLRGRRAGDALQHLGAGGERRADNDRASADDRLGLEGVVV